MLYQIQLGSINNKPVLACGSKVCNVFCAVDALLHAAHRQHLLWGCWYSSKRLSEKHSHAEETISDG